MGKVNETQIANILKFMQDRHVFASIERMTYCPVDMEFAMSVIETIGTYRNPKFRIDDENRFVYENMVRWVHGDTEMKCVSPDDSKKVIPGDIAKGIYIAGNTGTGKTWCLDIMSKYTQLLNIGIKIVGERHALTWGGFRADAIIADYQQTGEYYRFAKQPIICIHDLGTESTDALYMGNRMNVLRAILEYRGDRSDQITLISSNIPMEHKMFTDKYGDRVASRMREMCNYFELTGQDRRKL